MARIQSVLKFLCALLSRDWQTLNSFMGSNLFYLGVAILFAGAGTVLMFSMVLICSVLVFPVSSSVLRKIPEERWMLWPLSVRDKILLTIFGLGMNPLFWIVLLLWISGKFSKEIILFLGLMPAVGWILPRLKIHHKFPIQRLWFPTFPGAMNQLIRKNIREFTSTLDFYCAGGFACFAALFRITGKLPDESLFPLSMILVLILSTYTQNVFGLDGEGGMVRYSLLPISRWKIFFAKDVVVIACVSLMTLPLLPLASISSALVMIAFGRYASLNQRMDQLRWRFQAGGSFISGLMQIFLMISMGSAVSQFGAPLLLCCVLFYLLSLWFFGRMSLHHAMLESK